MTRPCDQDRFGGELFPNVTEAGVPGHVIVLGSGHLKVLALGF